MIEGIGAIRIEFFSDNKIYDSTEGGQGPVSPSKYAYGRIPKFEEKQQIRSLSSIFIGLVFTGHFHKSSKWEACKCSDFRKRLKGWLLTKDRFLRFLTVYQ